MRTADSPARVTSQKDDQEEYSAESKGEGSHLIDDDEASEQGEPSRRRSKRARIATSKPTAPRKKYVKGKQGGLQGIMKMPIEVFTEIAYHITPADLITLIRTNKFFRAMLLTRSGLPIWQRAQANMPGLPPCLTGMSEPRYAALIFSKFCTLCGASAPAKPDPWLRVRLCAPCRETKLQETTWGYEPAINYVATSCRITLTKPHRIRGIAPTFCIGEELEQVRRLREEFQQKGDHPGLREWEREKGERLNAQNIEAEQLHEYLNSVAQSRVHELVDLKAERREQVHERLRALGWDEKYLDFWGAGREERKWHSLVDVPKPLTERIWTNLLPKLIPFLEENQLRVDNRDSRRRRSDRLEKVQRLMCQFKRDTHPYQAIVDALGLTVPAIGASYDTNEVLHIPFPTIDAAVGWDFIKDIYEEENSLEQVEELFNQRRGQLNDTVLKWREEIENQLVKQYIEGGNGTEQTDKADPIVTVQGSTEATKQLSTSARFLLRADTVLITQPSSDTSVEDQGYGLGARENHFPATISTFSDDPRSYTGDCTDLTYLDKLVRHASVEKIVKTLLKDMGTPDVAHIELSSKKESFACGRCSRLIPTTWENLVKHYQLRAQECEGGKYKHHRYSTRHPIIIRDMHDLMSEPNAKPLVRMVSEDERKAIEDYMLIKEGRIWCLICSGVSWYRQGMHDSLELMQEHMGEMHDITGDLVEGLHYSKDYRSSLMHFCHLAEWQKEWDAYYDAQQAGNGVEDDLLADPSSLTETASA